VDIAQSEKVEAELDHMIRRADERRRLSEGERAEHELWHESERQYEAKRQAELVFAWCEFYERQAQAALANGERIAAANRAKAARLLGGQNGHPNGHHHEERNGHHGD
jgi:hypothetical protein